jgi:hypothetical protein
MRTEPAIRVALSALLLGACATSGLRSSPGVSTIRGGVYSNETYQIKLRFANVSGWHFFATEETIQSCPSPESVFCASNPSRLLNVMLTLEDGGFEMSNADYQTATRKQLVASWGDKVQGDSAQQVRVNGQDAIVWTYTLEGDTVVQAFLSRGTQNFRLIFITPQDAFERRRPEIHAIIRSFELTSPTTL